MRKPDSQIGELGSHLSSAYIALLETDTGGNRSPFQMVVDSRALLLINFPLAAAPVLMPITLYENEENIQLLRANQRL